VRSTKHYDVLIAGAGISGIAAAYHLQTNCPDKSFALLEGRDAIGGTWDLFRFPGIRSDSDMYTLGFSFRPWPNENRIGEGEDIRQYIEDTAEEIGVMDKIQFGTRIERVSFSSADALWTVYVRDAKTGETDELTCSFFWSCMGYYRYDAGYTPDFEGTESFRGPIVHPQRWDESLDYTGKRIVVIGSGATAMTMVPVLAKQADKVTMVQRSPTYVFSWPRRDGLAIWLRKVLGPERAHPIIRWKNIKFMALLYGLLRRFPRLGSRILIGRVRRRLGPGFDVDTHFTPPYAPWDQRLCLVPDGDLLDAIVAGKADVATGHIDRFTERGLRLQSGEELDADVIVTATGFSLEWLGGIDVEVDGAKVQPEEQLVYKGCMLSHVPNCAFGMGYINSSWTLRVELACEYVCELLQHMDSHGYRTCVPEPDASVQKLPLWDLNAGYVKRGEGHIPMQGDRDPWRVNQNYALDVALLRDQPVDDGTLRFEGSAPAKVEDTTARTPLVSQA
jgi:cation diffusion facilitator CzcD-associated flavoprotein CzcO